MRKILVLLCLVVFAGAVRAEENKPELSKLYVSGEGKVFIKPDTVIINAGLTTEDESAAVCHKKNREIMNAVLKNIKGFGLEDKDISSVTYTMSPKYSRIYSNTKKTNENKIIGYTLTHIFSIKYKDTKRAGELADSLVSAGVTNIRDLDFTIENADNYRSQARKKAVENARSKAEELAQSAGVKLSKVLSIQESEIQYPHAKMAGFREMMSDSSVGSAPSPIMAGEMQISSSVNITYMIEQ